MSIFKKASKMLAYIITPLMLVGALVAGPAPVSAAPSDWDPLAAVKKANNDKDSGVNGVEDVITKVGSFARLLIYIMAGISVIFIIYGAFVWMTGIGGEGDGASKGKKIISNAVVGLIVAILSFVIVQVVVSLGGTFSSGN